MATTTQTLRFHRSGARRANRAPATQHHVLGWVAVVGACIAVAVLAVVILVGGSDSDVSTVRLDPQADMFEHDAHLKGLAGTYSRPVTTPGVGDSTTGRSVDPTSEIEFIPGSNRMPAE